MKLQLLSDLHLETQPGFQAEPAPGADLLVLAGDIGSYQYGSRLPGADFGLERFSPLAHLAGWPTPVVYVPGNHEYDALDFDSAHSRLRDTCERLGIRWLEREVWIHEGVRFVGTTLWSDFDALAPAAPPAARLKAREKAFRAANHYLRTTGTTRRGLPWLAEQVRAQALDCKAWLTEALARPHAGPTVAITHFAPSLESRDPRYGLTPGTAAPATIGTRCSSMRTSGCMAICIARATTSCAAAGSWPIRWAMRARASRRASCRTSWWRSPARAARRRRGPSPRPCSPER